MRARLLSLLGFVLLGGCVGRGIDAPSLGLRSVEKQPVDMPDEASEPQVALDPALATRLEKIEAHARTGHAAFEEAHARAAAAVGKAGNAPVGSEPWTVAQQELSLLEAARTPVGHAAGEIDALRVEPANATPGNRDAIQAAGDRITALSQAENDAVVALSGRLRN